MESNNKFEEINEKCGTFNTMIPLSVSSAAYSVVLILLTIPLNGMLIYTIYKNHSNKTATSLFYKLLLNIAIADLMTGIVADPAALNFYVKEILRQKIGLVETYIIHLSIFLTDAVALMTMTFLSFDRMAALLFPIKYHNGMKRIHQYFIVASVYPLACILTIPYFKVNYIRQLIIFSALNVVLAVLSLIVTAAIFKIHAKRNRCRKTETNHSAANVQGATSTPGYTTKASLAKAERKATKTFMIMVGVFIVVYLPACIAMLYMNSCGENCDCVVVHIMRDVAASSILSSSVFRPLNFLLTMTQLKETMLNILFRKRNHNRATNSEDSRATSQ